MAKRKTTCVDDPELINGTETAIPLNWGTGIQLLAPRVLAALFQLDQARRSAWRDSAGGADTCDLWTHAVTLALLRATHGITDIELRALIARGLIEFRIETTRKKPAARRADENRKLKTRLRHPASAEASRWRRTFRKADKLTLARNTCFVISETGVMEVSDILERFTLGGALMPDQRTPSTVVAAHGEGKVTQAEDFKWDPGSDEWTLNGELIRKVAPSAKRLRALLDAAQAVHSVCPIPSPFASECSNSKERVKYLSRELNVLNQGQQKRHVHLSSCDKGRAFNWKILV